MKSFYEMLRILSEESEEERKIRTREEYYRVERERAAQARKEEQDEIQDQQLNQVTNLISNMYYQGHEAKDVASEVINKLFVRSTHAISPAYGKYRVWLSLVTPFY